MKALLIISALLLTSCTDDKKGSIKCYSGNTLIYEGKSREIIHVSYSDNYEFTELGTNNSMEVSGNCIIKYDN